jgi:hypothetical protein
MKLLPHQTSQMSIWRHAQLFSKEEHAAEQNNNIYDLLQGAELEAGIMVLPQQQITSSLLLSTILQLIFF